MQGFLITLVFALLCTPSGLFLLENFNFNKDFGREFILLSTSKF